MELKIGESEKDTFFSEDDEKRFFAAIYNLSQYREVNGKDRNLTVRFGEPITHETLFESIVLLRRYDIDLSCLKPLLEKMKPADVRYFKRPSAFWYSALFDTPKGTAKIVPQKQPRK